MHKPGREASQLMDSTPTHTIRYLLAGCGRIGKRHATVITTTGKLVAVADVDGHRAGQFAASFGCRSYHSLEAMLAAEADNADVVVIATPNGWHARHSIAGLQAGLHVLCEKPMAISGEDARTMQQYAGQVGKHLWVVKQNRYNPPVQAVHSLLRKGRLGRILSVQVNCFWNRDAHYYKDSWRGTLKWDGGTLYTQFSHFVDLLIWFLGDAKPLYAALVNNAHEGMIAFEDTGIVTLQFSNEVLGSLCYTVNAFGQNMEGSITLFGEKGTVKIGGQYLNVLEYQSIDGEALVVIDDGNEPNQYGTYQGSMSNHHLVYENLAAVLKGQGPMVNDLTDAVKTVELIENIYQLGRQ